MKEYYPREYELMKAFVKAGRWHVSGASWDATDTLVPSVESFIRNIMLGQEFYRKERDYTVLWNKWWSLS